MNYMHQLAIWLLSILHFAGDTSKTIAICAPGNGVCWQTYDRTWNTDSFMAIGRMLYEFMGGNFCLLLNGLEQIMQIIGQLSWTQEICWLKSYLEAIDFPYFIRMTAFLMNCKLSSRKISRWCGVTKLVTRSISVLMFFSGGVCWWGRINILIWLCSRDVAGWRLNLGYMVNNHWCVPVLVFGCTCGSSVSKNIFALMLVSSMRA